MTIITHFFIFYKTKFELKQMCDDFFFRFLLRESKFGNISQS